MRNHDIASLVLRLTLAILMLFHGIHKLYGGIGPVESLLSEHGLPGWLGYGVFLGEVVAPVMIILGYYARVGAVLLALSMLTAILLTDGFFPIRLTAYGAPTIELLLLYMMMAVTLFFFGPGRYSLNRQ